MASMMMGRDKNADKRGKGRRIFHNYITKPLFKKGCFYNLTMRQLEAVSFLPSSGIIQRRERTNIVSVPDNLLV